MKYFGKWCIVIGMAGMLSIVGTVVNLGNWYNFAWGVFVGFFSTGIYLMLTTLEKS